MLAQHPLDIEFERQTFPRLKAEVDDLDLASAPCLRGVQQRVRDQRAGSVGIMDAKNLYRLTRVGDRVDQVARRACAEAFR
jgi:hypothetical protein